MIIREYKSEDLQEIIKLFFETVHNINKKDYDENQINAWTGNLEEKEKTWDNTFLNHYSLVVEENGVIVGFGDIDDTGYLDRLYVHKDYQNMKIATKLCDKLEKCKSYKKLTTHASITAKPFFEKRGYKVIKMQEVERSGVVLRNFVMEKITGGENA